MSHLPFLTVIPNDSQVKAEGIDTPTSSSERISSPSVTASNLTASDLREMVSKTGQSRSRIPSVIAFPLAAIITLGTSAGLYSVAAELTGFELATISRSLNDPMEIGALVGWRIFELLVNWSAGFDYWDTASLFLLSNAPYYVLLPIFYSISPISVLVSLSIDLFSTTLPFFLLRTLNPYNDAISSQSVATGSTKLYIGLFSTVIYATTLYSSLQTFLPAYVIGTFDYIRSLEVAHALSFPVLATAALPLGNAAKDFLFTPTTYNARGTVVEEFDPKSATLGETFAWNIGLSGWGKREDVLVGRTILLVLLTLGNSLARVYGTIEGAELPGAIGWGMVFAAAHVLAGVGVGYIGDV